MNKKHVVILTEEERAALRGRVAAGRRRARALTRVRILLKADQGLAGPRWADHAIAAAVDVSRSTIERVRRRFAEDGLEAAVARRAYRRKLDGEQEAHLVALACSAPPDGYSRWSLRLLADQMVELTDVGTLSCQTARRVLNKNELKPWLRKQWVVPPQANAEFVWRMEDVLEVRTRPYDPKRPQVCMDELSKQLVADGIRRCRASPRASTTSTSGIAPPTSSSSASRSVASAG